MLKLNLLFAGEKEISNDRSINDDKKHHVRLDAAMPGVKNHSKGYFQCHTLSNQQLDVSVPAFNGLPGLWFEDIESSDRIFGRDNNLNGINAEDLMFADLSA